jgi:hypothetical protein
MAVKSYIVQATIMAVKSHIVQAPVTTVKSFYSTGPWRIHSAIVYSSLRK